MKDEYSSTESFIMNRIKLILITAMPIAIYFWIKTGDQTLGLLSYVVTAIVGSLMLVVELLQKVSKLKKVIVRDESCNEGK